MQYVESIVIIFYNITIFLPSSSCTDNSAVNDNNYIYIAPLTLFVIESIKTTSMEDVSTRVLEKIKNI